MQHRRWSASHTPIFSCRYSQSGSPSSHFHVWLSPPGVFHSRSSQSLVPPILPNIIWNVTPRSPLGRMPFPSVLTGYLHSVLPCMHETVSESQTSCRLNRLNIFSDEWTNIVTPVLVFSLYLEWDLRRCLIPVCRLYSTWQLKAHSSIQVICFCKVYMNESIIETLLKAH